ncbi:MAG: glycoside hydrolase family 3 C-terminal domain-containing protein [Clostridia bacterium]|nr:glycoside hydrolase family 3 C-terminal domain-containing protein [Clostridia bacterium]
MKDYNLEEKARLLSGRDFWNTAKVCGADRIRFSDGPSGLRVQGKKGDHLGINGSMPATCFPAHSALAASFNCELVKETGACIGREGASAGVDVLLAPDLNIKSYPLNGRNFEYFSEDPYLNGKLGASYLDGVQSTGVGGCVKHFAANNREFGRMVCDSVVDMRTLREIYLTAFEMAVKESKPAAVMTAYNRLNGVYCNENGWLLNDVLRGEWGFEGIVVSDWGGTHDRVASVKAGADLEMPCCYLSKEEIVSAVKDGRLNEEEVDSCAERIVKLSHREKPARRVDISGHKDFAQRCAEECAVLLKNDGLLPLKQDIKIALIGDFAKKPQVQGGGSAKVNPKAAVNLKSCLKGAKYAGGGAKAVRLAKKSDAVIYCMGYRTEDAEGADRLSYSLPDKQIKLLEKLKKVNKNIVVVLFCGCAVDTSWDGEIPAVLYAGLSGQASSQAVADILTGKINPSGKLAETFLKDYKPCVQDPYSAVYGEGMKVGYRGGGEAKYPFGFGLSYTRFEYSNLRVNDKGASFDVKNAGEVYGGEAVQLYINFPKNANAPELQLKGFDKVFLNAGETKKIFIPFDEYSFRSFDVKENKWVKVSGGYGIFIGASSADLRLEGKIDIEGDCDRVAAPDTLGLIPAVYPLLRDNKGRVIATHETPFCELKNAKGLWGKTFAWIALAAVRKRRTIYGTMEYLPLRTLAQFGRFDDSIMQGLNEIFNGKLFKGLKTISSTKKDK